MLNGGTRSRRTSRLGRFGSRVRGRGSKGRRGWESMPVFDHVLCEEFALGFGDAEFEGGGLAGAVSCGEGSCALGGTSASFEERGYVQTTRENM